MAKQQKTALKLSRQQNGKLIFEAGKVSPLDENKNLYWVDSQHDNEKGYKVNFNTQECECPDYENRLQACKHWFAVKYFKMAEIKKVMKEAELKVQAISKKVGVTK